MRRLLPFVSALSAAALLAACGSSRTSSSPSTSGSSSQASASTSTSATTTTATPSPTIGFEGIPLEPGSDLAPASTTTQGTRVAGIQCGSTEQLAYHIHAHLAVYVQGQSKALPAGIGIPGAAVQQSQFGPVVGQGRCFYWLHTHTADGVVHVESPSTRVYTLGNFFDEWRQPLTASRVGPATGKVTAFVNGKPWSQDLRSIPLASHSAIQLDVGAPAVRFKPAPFASTAL